MVKDYPDLRVVRTRQMIRDAFIDLLEHKSYDKITISELTKQANINRVTFYSHYTDLDDFLSQFVDELIDNIFECMKPLYKQPYKPGFELETLTHLLEYIADNEKIYHMMFVSKGIPYFTPRMIDFLRNLMLTHPRNENGYHFPGVEIETDIASWYGTSALIGTISMWIGDGMPYPPRYLAEQIVKLNPFRINN